MANEYVSRDRKLPADVVAAFKTMALPTTASRADMRKTWKMLVLQCHPDKNSSASAADEFLGLNKAKSTLEKHFSRNE